VFTPRLLGGNDEAAKDFDVVVVAAEVDAVDAVEVVEEAETARPR